VLACGYVGCQLTWADFDKATRVDTAAELEHFTKMRHSIVHRGYQPKLMRSRAGDCVDLIDTVATAINSDIVTFYH
jgi:hypothetical protein